MYKQDDGESHEAVSDEQWFSNDIIDKHTLYFPYDMEKVYTMENIGSDVARVNLRNILYIGLCYYIIAEIWTIAAFIILRTSALSFILQGCLFIVGQIIGFVDIGWLTKKEQWKRLHTARMARYIAMPQALGYLTLCVYILRTENFTYPFDFFQWQISPIGFIYVLSSVIIGICVKFLPALIVTAIFFLFIILRAVILGALDTCKDAWVRAIGYLLPGAIAFFVNHWAMYILEQRLRINFITKKRLEIETRRLQERQKSVEAILELVLPKDVITRMQIQNYSFSIVDRFESAFCVFVDFFSAQKLDLIEPYACIKALNATFMSLDLLLQEYPTIEKIKTISSKGLLISTPSGPDEMIVYSDAVTSFCFELFRKLNGDSFNELPELLKRSVTIGVAFGEIVAGLVGERRFCYDVYGDIVNTASRMQTLGLLHPILCTEDTFSQFSSTTQMKWRSCGIHSVKGKGDMLIYRAASEADDKKEATGNLADSLSRLGVDSRSKEDRKPSYIDVGDDAIRSILISFKKQHEPISPVSPSERHANLGNIKAIPSQDRAQRLVERRVTLQKLQKLSVSGNDTSFPDTSKLQPFSLTDIGRNQKTLKMREVENPKKRSIPILDYFIEYSNHWNHIDRFSLKFFELKNREEYRNGVRQNVKHRLRTVFQEGCCATVISVSCILMATIYAIFIDPDRVSTKITAREDIFSKKGRFPDHPWIGIAVACGGFILLLSASVFHFFQLRRSLQINEDKNGVKGSTFRYTLAMYCLKILSAYTTILGVQITAYGQTYLSAQGLTCLFLSYAAGLDYDDIEPELSFTVVAMFLSILTLGTNALWVYARVAALTDLLQIFSLLTIVLVGKYRYAVAKRMNLLLNLKLKASQELQDIESAFFFELLEAILPSRLTQNMLENPISFGRLYLELFETVTVIHLDITSFTVMSSNMPPSDLVDLLNMLFTRFDKICQGHNVEKILTIGDAYVAMRMPKSFKGSRTRHLEGHQKIHPSQGPTSAGEHLHYTSQNASDGPNQRSENPGGNSTETVKWDENAEAAMEACIAAVEMQEALKSMIMTWSEERPESGINSDQIGKLRARIGIHTGPAFGCLTGGATKIKYELMGEAMEVSEQIERMAEPGTVRSSLSTMYHVFQGMGLFLNEIMGWECLQASTSFKDGQELISQKGISFIARRPKGHLSTDKPCSVQTHPEPNTAVMGAGTHTLFLSFEIKKTK